MTEPFNPSPRRPLVAPENVAGASPEPEPSAMPIYHDEAPAPRPGDPPPPPNPATPSTPLAHLDTGLLNRMQRDLRSIIPADPTFMAHVGALLRALISHELASPDRIAADKAANEATIKQAAERARAEAHAAAPADDADAHAAIDARHDQAQARQELAAKQARDRLDFEAHQQQERDALNESVPA